MTFEFHDVVQTSDEWFNLRLGKPAGSAAAKYMAHEGKPEFGDPAHDYAMDLALEQLTGRRGPGMKPTAAMMRGVELEPVALELYASTKFVDPTNGGWFDCGTYGTSPDALVGDDGVVEIKCTEMKAHWALLKKREYDSKYHWQLMNHLDVTERDWVDYVNYCPYFPDYACLFIYRLYRKDYIAEIQKLRARREKFIVMIEAKKVIVEESRDVK